MDGVPTTLSWVDELQTKGHQMAKICYESKLFGNQAILFYRFASLLKRTID